MAKVTFNPPAIEADYFQFLNAFEGNPGELNAWWLKTKEDIVKQCIYEYAQRKISDEIYYHHM